MYRKLFIIAIILIDTLYSHPLQAGITEEILSQTDQPPITEQCFTVTAYYSPLPNQKKYTLGSFAAETRMEGRGVRGASGKKVYSGMLAGSKEVPFGTKIHLNGLGTGTVYDRGGAIKTGNGECAGRLDVWVGRGDEGRRLAEIWGKRKIYGFVIGQDETIADSIEPKQFLAKAELAKRIVNQRKLHLAMHRLSDSVFDVMDLMREPREKFVVAGRATF